MSALKLFLGCVFVMGLGACTEDTPKVKVESFNEKIDRLNAMNTTLTIEDLPLASPNFFSTGMNSVPSGMDAEKVTRVRGLLTQYIELGDQVLARSKDKDIVWTDEDKVVRNLAQARYYLAELDGYEDRQKLEEERLAKLAEEQRKKNERLEAQRRQAQDKIADANRKLGKIRALSARADGYHKQININFTVDMVGYSNFSQISAMNVQELRMLRSDAQLMSSQYEQIDMIFIELAENTAIDQSNISYSRRVIKNEHKRVLANIAEMDKIYAEKTGTTGALVRPAKMTTP